MGEPKYQVEIIKVDNLFVGIIWRKGIYANSGPKKDFESILSWIQEFDVSDHIKTTASKTGMSIAQYIVDVWKGLPGSPLRKIRFDYSGLSEPTQRVLEQVRKIPRGSVMSYGEVANKSKLPKAARFVGNVMANNRYPLLIPCHRVVRKDGIGSYGIGGPGEKIRLLSAEKST